MPTKPKTSRRPRCVREGCPRRAAPGRDSCSFVCRAIATDMARAERACRALGADNPMTSRLWSEIVELSDAWTRYQDVDHEVYQHALSVGFTDEQWRAIKNRESPEFG